jgi:hypothetical protein
MTDLTALRLDGREYKLLLSPHVLAEAGPVEFWISRIAPVLDQRGFTVSGVMAEKERRHVQFWDVPAGLLGAHDFSLRGRSDVVSAATDTEVSLKRRTENSAMAEVALPTTGPAAKSKFEADIGPAPAGAEPTALGVRFSRSTRCKSEMPKTLGGVLDLFPTLGASLSEGPGELARDTALVSGPVVTELVFEGASVDLSGETAQFALTSWTFNVGAAAHAAVEISFRCKQKGAVASASALKAAAEMFAALQTGLADIVETATTSKTALVLPPVTA